ncbi:hypothetical protein Poli38472_006011 [Pythium oligandrum]|uniref:Uncharacterized protein n=1 Tax=Pythium oligandrum TaxID=41045 RepID=A0A8K1CUL3_PYTOL|nr:hypothetical protein Poli38472_006011 [Pythium oligandrum]|eukprot:TMW68543.1 hypothetical protein Poli38472_006011 [Pythium oligandrum]
MVLKMTLSFTRSMPPLGESGINLQTCDEASDIKKELASSICPSPIYDRNQDEEEEKQEELKDEPLVDDDLVPEGDKDQNEVLDASVMPPSSNAKHKDSIGAGMIEISLKPDQYLCSPLPSESDLDAIDELMESAKEGDLELFRQLCETLKRRHITPDCASYMGWTPAHWAARFGHLHILEYLDAEHVNLDLLDKKGDSLLHKAAANGQYRVCQWLLQHGFNVQAKNNNGLTPLGIAQHELAITPSSDAVLCETILAREDAVTF